MTIVFGRAVCDSCRAVCAAPPQTTAARAQHEARRMHWECDATGDHCPGCAKEHREEEAAGFDPTWLDRRAK